MHRPRRDLLSRPALAEQRDRKHRGGRAAEQIEDRRQRRIERHQPGQRRLQARACALDAKLLGADPDAGAGIDVRLGGAIAVEIGPVGGVQIL